MMWIFDLLVSGFAGTVLPFMTSLAGLAVPGLGAVGAIGGAMLPRALRLAKWVLILGGLAGIAIYILVIKLDAARSETRAERAETRAVAAEGNSALWKAAVEERDRNMAAVTADLLACGERTRQNQTELRALRRENEAALAAQAKTLRNEMAQRLSLKSTKEKMNASAQSCTGPIHPADRDYLVWMCERARGRGEAPAGCAAP